MLSEMFDKLASFHASTIIRRFDIVNRFLFEWCRILFLRTLQESIDYTEEYFLLRYREYFDIFFIRRTTFKLVCSVYFLWLYVVEESPFLLIELIRHCFRWLKV